MPDFWDFLRNSAQPIGNSPQALSFLGTQPSPANSLIAQMMAGRSGVDRMNARPQSMNASPEGMDTVTPALTPAWDVVRNQAQPIAAQLGAGSPLQQIFGQQPQQPLKGGRGVDQILGQQAQEPGWFDRLFSGPGSGYEAGSFESPLALGLISSGAAMLNSRGNFAQALSEGLMGMSKGVSQAKQNQQQRKAGERAQTLMEREDQEYEAGQAQQSRIAQIQAKLERGEPLTAGDRFTLDPQGFAKGEEAEWKVVGNQLLKVGRDGAQVMHTAPREPREAPETWGPMSPEQAQAYGLPSPAGYRVSSRGQVQQIGGVGDSTLKPSDITGIQTRYRSDPTISRWTTVAPVLKGAFESATQDTAASDLALTYAFAKIMDPESVVREGEQVMVSNTASLPDLLQGAIARVNGKARLTPETRQALMQELQTRASELYSSASTQDAWWRADAQQFGLKPERVGPDLPHLPGLPDLTNRQQPPQDFSSEFRPSAAPAAANPPPGGNLYDGVPGAQPPQPQTLDDLGVEYGLTPPSAEPQVRYGNEVVVPIQRAPEIQGGSGTPEVQGSAGNDQLDLSSITMRDVQQAARQAGMTPDEVLTRLAQQRGLSKGALRMRIRG